MQDMPGRSGRMVMAAALLAFCLLAACDTDSGDGGTVIVPGSILMCGRSVMAGWFAAWGSDTSQPVERCGRTLCYGELSSPPDIVASFASLLSGNEGIAGAFFKLCFVDFEGGGRTTAAANLERNKGYIRQAYDLCRSRGIPVVFGNALPSVQASTDADLVWNHREYNAFLRGFAAGNPGCAVLDVYGILATAGGWLKPEFAASADDSHLNASAYAALDGALCQAIQ